MLEELRGQGRSIYLKEKRHQAVNNERIDSVWGKKSESRGSSVGNFFQKRGGNKKGDVFCPKETIVETTEKGDRRGEKEFRQKITNLKKRIEK